MIVEKFRSCLLFFLWFSIALGFGNAGKFIAENQFLLLMCFLSEGGRKPKRFIDFSKNEFRRIKLLFVKRFVQGCSTVTQLMLSEKSSTCVEQIKIHFECLLSAKFDSDKESCERTKYFKAAVDWELKIFARKQCDS